MITSPSVTYPRTPENSLIIGDIFLALAQNLVRSVVTNTITFSARPPSIPDSLGRYLHIKTLYFVAGTCQATQDYVRLNSPWIKLRR